MKRTKIFIVAILATFSLFADYTGLIWTPKGTAIQVTYRDEHDADYLYNLTESTKEAYPNATCMGNSSNCYNSHCYAWNMQDNYDIHRECWLNNSDVFTYWEDGSYILTTSDEATVIYYPIGEHSAIKSWRNSSLYISKWGDGPLMEHAPTYGPYINMSSRQYYIKNETSTPEEPNPEPTPDVITGVLSPGNGDYLKGQEYEFSPSQDINYDGECTYVWTIYNEEDNGRDAVALGKATLECDEFPNIAKVTFLTGGLFTITVEIYDENEEQLAVFTCQPYVL